MSNLKSNEVVTITQAAYAAQRAVLVRARRAAPTGLIAEGYDAALRDLDEAEQACIAALMVPPAKKG